MDEQYTMPNISGQPEVPQEVVLRYEAPWPHPVTERYVQPTPLPGRRMAYRPAAPAAVPVSAPPAATPARKRSHKGLWIFLICLAALVTVAVVLGVLYLRGALRSNGDRYEYRYEYEWHSDPDDYSDADTSIERYPTGGETRLRYSESHGSVLSIQEVYERVNPCTVTVATRLPGGGAIIGTGVIFTSDGYILTNAHVITGGNECYVVRDTGTSYAAKLVGYDAEKDLAVIKIDAHGLPTAEFGDSDALTVGDTVYAIGNPLGAELRGTLTDGIVSAINRDVLVDGVEMTLIQTNAALNNGNSGGPLINVYGQVVGINTMKMGSTSTVSVEGLGFAIPISSSAWMVDDLIAYGEILGEPVLGISVDRTAVTLETGETALEIEVVEAGGPGDAAGLRAGDRIVRADGDPVEAVSDLLRARRRYGRGEVLPLEIERSGERLYVDVTLAAMDPES